MLNQLLSSMQASYKGIMYNKLKLLYDIAEYFSH